MLTRKKNDTSVPKSMQVQLSKLLGNSSKEALKLSRTKSEWKVILKKVLKEICCYLDENVETDEMHFHMIYSCILASEESLKDNNFWPGYVEGITRLALILMGDYPDHRRRKGGRKSKEYYKLNLNRRLTYIQDSNHRVRTLLAASCAGFPTLSCNVIDVMRIFREEQGYRTSNKDFLRWFRERYPKDYAIMF